LGERPAQGKAERRRKSYPIHTVQEPFGIAQAAHRSKPKPNITELSLVVNRIITPYRIILVGALIASSHMKKPSAKQGKSGFLARCRPKKVMFCRLWVA
jgi:hypothetical protein